MLIIEDPTLTVKGSQLMLCASDNKFFGLHISILNREMIAEQYIR